MIDDFVELLHAAARANLIGFDETTVRAPHHDVSAFDADALASDSARLRAVVARLDAGEARAVGRPWDADWSGMGADAAEPVVRAMTGRVADAIGELVACADTLDEASAAVDDILARYRRAMEVVCDPAVIAPGAMSPDDARAELVARIEYADATGRTASTALVDLTRLPASSGELVLAGDR